SEAEVWIGLDGSGKMRCRCFGRKILPVDNASLELARGLRDHGSELERCVSLRFCGSRSQTNEKSRGREEVSQTHPHKGAPWVGRKRSMISRRNVAGGMIADGGQQPTIPYSAPPSRPRIAVA